MGILHQETFLRSVTELKDITIDLEPYPEACIGDTDSFSDRFGAFVCDNADVVEKVVGGIVGCLAAASSFLFLKRCSFTQTFYRVSEIPKRYVMGSVTLEGHVREVDCLGRLYVKHKVGMPSLIASWFKRKLTQDDICDVTQSCNPAPYPGLLMVHLAGLQMTAESVLWLMDNVVDRRVWFRLLQLHRDHIVCEVSMLKNLVMEVDVNKALIERGLAKILPIGPCFNPPCPCLYPPNPCKKSDSPFEDSLWPCPQPPDKCKKVNVCDCETAKEKGPFRGELIPCANLPAVQPVKPDLCRQTEYFPPGSCRHTPIPAFEQYYLELVSLEAEARQLRLGMWSDPNTLQFHLKG